MPQTVDVEDVGIFEFPDEFSEEQIKGILDRDVPPLRKGVLADTAARIGRDPAQAVAGTIKGLARGAQIISDARTEDLANRKPNGPLAWRNKQRVPEIGDRDYVAPGDIKPEIRKLRETSQQRLEESPVYQFGQETHEAAQEVYRPNPSMEGTVRAGLIKAGASTLPILASAAAGPAAPLVAMGMYGAQVGEQGAEEAIEMGHPDKADEAFMTYAGIGVLTEVGLGMPMQILRYIRGARKAGIDPIKFGKEFKTRLVDYAKEAFKKGAEGVVREGIQEGTEQLGQNIAAKAIGFNPDRELTKDVWKAMWMGGVVGGVFGAGFGVAQRFDESPRQQLGRELKGAEESDRSFLRRSRRVADFQARAGMDPRRGDPVREPEMVDYPRVDLANVKDETDPAALQRVADTAPPSETIAQPVNFEITTPPTQGKTPVTATGQWDIIDADEIGRLGGVSSLQERNRKSAQSKQQIAEIANKLDTRYLGESNTAADGAPVIDMNGERLAGYGRLAAIKLAYESENEASGKYRKFVESEAARLGLNSKLATVKNPVLVRRVQAFQNGTREQFAADSNADIALQFTPTELALADAKAIQEGDLLKLFTVTEDGQVNREFLDGLYSRMKNRGGLKTTDGARYLPAMEQRAKVAVLTTIFRDHSEAEWLVRQVVENVDELGIKRQINGIMAMAPRLARIRDAMPEFDISNDIATALRDFLRFRADVNKGYVTSIQEWLSQADLFAADRTPDTDMLLRFLVENTTTKGIVDGLDRYTRGVDEQIKAKGTMEMFGDIKAPTRRELLTKSLQNESAPEQLSLETRPTKRRPEEPAKPEDRPPGQEPVPPGENPPGEIPFEQISAGHRKFAAELIKLEAGGVLNRERRLILQELFRNSKGNWLGAITMVASGRLERAGLAYINERKLAMRKGLLALTQSEQIDGNVWDNPVFEPIMVFLHEYAHLADFLILNQQERKTVTEAFERITKEQRTKLFTAFAGTGTKKLASLASYYAKNREEFLAESFAEWVVSRKVADKSLRSILKKLYDNFAAAIKRFLSIDPPLQQEIDSMVPIFERMIEGKESLNKIVGRNIEFGAPAATRSEAEKDMQLAESRQARGRDFAVSEQGRGISGQVTFLQRKLEPLIPRDVPLEEQLLLTAALEKVGYGEVSRTYDFIDTLVYPEDFYRGMQRLKDSPLKATYQKEVGMRFRLLKRQMQGVLAEHAAMEKEFATEAWQKKMQRAEAKMDKALWLDYAQRIFNANVADALASFRTLLQKQSNIEGRAEATAQLMASTEAKAQFSEAVKSAIGRIVTAFGKSPETVDFLYRITPSEGSIQEIIDTYRRLEKEGRPDDLVVRWAAETLANAQELTRNLIAIEAARQIDSVRKQYDALELKLADSLRDSPRSTAKKVVRAVARTATDAERAMVAWKAINRELVQKFEEYETLDMAAEMARKFLSDTEVQQYERDVYGTIIQDRPDNGEDYDNLELSTGIGLPDGTVSKPILLYGDEAKFIPSFAELNRVIQVMSVWVVNNQQDTTIDYWTRKLSYLQNVLATSRIMMPSKLMTSFQWMSRPFGMTQFFADDLGSRIGGRFKVSLANHSRAVELAKNLLHDNAPNLTIKHLTAAKSHGWNDALAGGRWYDEIGNALYASWQNPEGGLKMGDKLNGYTITAQDMAALEFDSTVSRQGFEIVQKGVVRGRELVANPVYFHTTIGDTGVNVVVQSTAVSRHTVTRHFNRKMLDVIRSYAAATPNAKFQILNDYFWQLVIPHIRDRANMHFDGQSRFEEAYRVIANKIDLRGLPSAARSLPWLIKEIATISGSSLTVGPGMKVEDVVSEELIAEFDKMMDRLNGEIEKDSNAKVETLDQRSSFTEARKRQLAGYWLYDHGFRDLAGMAHFAFGIHGYYFERASADFQRVIADLERQQTELNQEISRLVNAGRSVKEATNEAVADQAERAKLGKTFDEWEGVGRRLKIARALADLYKAVYSKQVGKSMDFDLTKLTRVTGAGVGAVLMSELTTLRNVSLGILYLGQHLNAVNGTVLRHYPSAFYRLWVTGMPKYLGSFLYSTAKAATVGVAKGAMAVAAHPMEALSNQGRVGFARFLEPILTEMSESVMHRIEMQQELVNRGYAEEYNTYDDVLAKLMAPTEGGTLRGEPAFDSVIARSAYGLMTLIEAPIVTGIGKALLPKLGDVALNHAVIQGTFDTIKKFETRLRYLHQKYRAAGVTRWDFANPSNPANYLTANEVFGKWMGRDRTTTDMNHLVRWFEYGPIGFQEAAVRFLSQVDAGNANSKFLADDEIWNLANAAVEDVNKPSAMNRPLQLRQMNGFWPLISPLMGWPLHRFRTWIKYASRAAADPNSSKAVLWGSVGMLAILPALIAGALSDVGTEIIARWMYWLFRTEERATRLPSERQGTKSKAIGWAISALNPIPFMDIVGNMVNDMPSRARSQPTFFVQNKLMDVMNYVSGVVQTGDITYGLPVLAKGILPLSAVVINRLPGVEGSIEALNMRRLMSRYGETDLLQPKGGFSGGRQLTELSPYPEKMLNAAMRGDDVEFMRLRDQAVEIATQMGKEDPEKYVAQLYAARNPYDRAFKRKLTDEQRDSLYAKMSASEAAYMQAGEEKYSHSAGLIGAPASFVRNPEASSGGGGGAGPMGNVGIRSAPRFGVSSNLRRGIRGGGLRRAGRGRSRQRGGLGSRALKSPIRAISGIRRKSIGRGRSVRRSRSLSRRRA